MDLDANPTSTIVAFQEGEEIQLEDGSTGIVYHQVKGAFNLSHCVTFNACTG